VSARAWLTRTNTTLIQLHDQYLLNAKYDSLTTGGKPNFVSTLSLCGKRL
jgi:hypothetical protein